jgi:hypothetical protein
MDAERPPSPADWSGSTWEGARLAVLLAGARMTMAQKLEWLEETTRATDHLHRRALERLRRTAGE